MSAAARTWIRNGIALVAILALGTALWFVSTSAEQARVGTSTPPTVDTVVDGVATSSVAQVGPAEASFTEGYDNPAGTRVVEVRLPVRGDEGPLACEAPILREAGGAGRAWAESSIELGLDGYGDDERRVSCPLDLSTFTLTSLFLVPEDAVGPFTVELTASELTDDPSAITPRDVFVLPAAP